MLTSRIPKITAAMLPAVDAALEVGAEVVVAAAKGRVPVRTGDLRDAIHADKETPGLVIAGNDDVFYAHIVEHGGVNTDPHPFLVPALEERSAEVVSGVRAAIKRIT
jgi:HK97 gp10 family phage protein